MSTSLSTVIVYGSEKNLAETKKALIEVDKNILPFYLKINILERFVIK